MKEYEQSINCLHVAINLGIKQAMCDLAWVLIDQNFKANLAEIKSLFTQTETNGIPEGPYGLGIVYKKLKQPIPALDCFYRSAKHGFYPAEKMIESYTHADNAYAWYLLADLIPEKKWESYCHSCLLRYKPAFDHLLSCQDNQMACNYLGSFFELNGNDALALKWFEKAGNRTEKNRLLAKLYLGICPYCRKGNLEFYWDERRHEQFVKCSEYYNCNYTILINHDYRNNNGEHDVYSQYLTSTKSIKFEYLDQIINNSTNHKSNSYINNDYENNSNSIYGDGFER